MKETATPSGMNIELSIFQRPPLCWVSVLSTQGLAHGIVSISAMLKFARRADGDKLPRGWALPAPVQVLSSKFRIASSLEAALKRSTLKWPVHLEFQDTFSAPLLASIPRFILGVHMPSNFLLPPGSSISDLKAGLCLSYSILYPRP